MKNFFVLFSVYTILSIQLGFARTNSTATVQEQLEALNKNWQNKNFDDLILQEKIPLYDDVSLIQMHLSLVEKVFREKNTKNLSIQQRQNRIYCLNILHNYWANGVFPKNLYHNERTPYFIDKFGTACAVGQLIISTGYQDLANRISNENNYCYINELKIKYPEINKWAEVFGFTIDELAWIQPNYALCDTNCDLEVQISVTNGVPPYSYLWHPTGQTSAHAFGICPGTNLSCTVIDGLGDTVPFFNCSIALGASIFIGNGISIPAAIPLYIHATSTNDNGSCDGTATVDVINGTPPFSYNWHPGGQTTQTATGLCAGTYHVSVVDLNWCGKSDSVVINSTVSINDIRNERNICIYPNPSFGFFTVNSNQIISGQIAITNTLGEIVFEENLINQSRKEINLKNISSGIYFVQVSDGERSVMKKILIE